MSNTFPSIDGLVTGKIRDVQVFLHVVAMMLRLRERGVFRRVLLSLWREDLQAYREVLPGLFNAGCVVVDNGNALPVRSVGNYWEQVKTFESGLQQVEDGVLVFKTRTDMLYYGGDDTVARLVEENAGFPCDYLGFKHKIWIPSFVALQPFFMADQCFLGLADDFRRFLRFDADVEAQGIDVPLYPGSQTHPASASAEIRFWIQPFLDHFEVLRSYRKVWPHAMNGHPQYPVLQKFHLGQQIYQEYLAVYWTVLHALFRVSEGQFCIANGINEEGQIIVRANAHSQNSEVLVEDSVNLQTPYPVSFSTDRGLKRFMDEGIHPFYQQVFWPASERTRQWRYTADFIQSFHQYLNQTLALAYPASTPTSTAVSLL